MENFFYFVESLMKTDPLLSLPLVFISGVLVSFTPCFYPLIPVILGILGIEEKASFKKVLSLSLVYVLGLSLIYTGLGIVCSLTGKIFGQFSRSFWVQFIGAVVFAFMGLVLLDLFSFLQFRLPLKFNHKRLGIFGAFFLGAIGGLISGSCTFPVLGAILFLTALNKNVFLGGVLLFVFS
ncbi:MAG: hypothetical protein J7K37_02255 [Candidatus Omnitrophica bacterium]|nr:hypothetical protein [Candidatus Omnitrophota bacterium]